MERSHHTAGTILLGGRLTAHKFTLKYTLMVRVRWKFLARNARHFQLLLRQLRSRRWVPDVGLEIYGTQ